MTQRDKWKKRPCVVQYWAFRDEVRRQKVEVPVSGSHICFVLPMPKSWSEKKKAIWDGLGHQIRPDIDNLEKALLDAIYDEDCVFLDSRVTKLWGYEGEIRVK